MYEKLNCDITPGSMNPLNQEIYQRGKLSRVADTELILYSNRTPQSYHQVKLLVQDELGGIKQKET